MKTQIRYKYQATDLHTFLVCNNTFTDGVACDAHSEGEIMFYTAEQAKEEAAKYDDQYVETIEEYLDHTKVMFPLEPVGLWESALKVVKIDNDNEYVFVTCPYCDNCEQHPIDEQRHHLQAFHITAWQEDNDPIETSTMECCHCKAAFTLEWDYRELILAVNEADLKLLETAVDQEIESFNNLKEEGDDTYDTAEYEGVKARLSETYEQMDRTSWEERPSRTTHLTVKHKPVYYIFGQEICQAFNNHGVRGAKEVMNTEVYGLNCFDASTPLHEIVGACDGWNEHCIIDKYQYASLLKYKQRLTEEG